MSPEIGNAGHGGAMGSLLRWVRWSIIAAVSVLSRALAFLLALVVFGLLGLLKEAGAAASLAIVVTCTVSYLLIRGRRAALAGQRLGDG